MGRRGCYGTPLVSTAGYGEEFSLRLPTGTRFDRVALQEEIATGQRVRKFEVLLRTEETLATSPGTASDRLGKRSGWNRTLAQGEAIGAKRIFLVEPEEVSGNAGNVEVVLRILASVASPRIRS